MNLFTPNFLNSVKIWDKDRLYNLYDLIKKYCGDSAANNFKIACDKSDAESVDNILTSLFCKLTDTDNIISSLYTYVEKFPQLYPDLNIDETRTKTIIMHIDKYYDKIKKIINDDLKNN